MSLHYLLDGYNLSRVSPKLDQANLEDERNALIRYIEQHNPQGSLKNKVTVVFDGHSGHWGQINSQVCQIIFSQNETADDKIKKLVEQAKNRKNIVVVTNDRDIQYAVRALGAKVLKVKEFMTNLRTSPYKKGQARDKSSNEKNPISKTIESNINSELKDLWLGED